MSLDNFSQLIGIWQDDKEIRKSQNSDHYIRIGSITKIFTAIAIKRLMSEGKINLKDFICKYFIFDFNFNFHQEITIEHLATMSSGLPDYIYDSAFLASCMINPEMKWTPEQLLHIAMKNPMQFNPGEKQIYSNTNYIVLGLILEKITRKSLEEVYQEFIFQPLGMDSTYLPTTQDLPKPHLDGFQYVNGELINITHCHPSMAWSSGGVVSTLDNLYIFAKELIKGNLLSFERCKTSPNNYGFGLMKIGNFFGHNGNFAGYNTILLVNPEKKIIVIVLTNLKQTIDGKSPADNIASEIIKEMI